MSKLLNKNILQGGLRACNNPSSCFNSFWRSIIPISYFIFTLVSPTISMAKTLSKLASPVHKHAAIYWEGTYYCACTYNRNDGRAALSFTRKKKKRKHLTDIREGKC